MRKKPRFRLIGEPTYYVMEEDTLGQSREREASSRTLIFEPDVESAALSHLDITIVFDLFFSLFWKSNAGSASEDTFWELFFCVTLNP